MQLAEDRYLPVQVLAARVDALMVHHQTSLVTAVGQQDASDLITSMPGGRQSPKKQATLAHAKKPWEKMSICHLHCRYGAAATKCEAPCSFVAEKLKAWARLNAAVTGELLYIIRELLYITDQQSGRHFLVDSV